MNHEQPSKTRWWQVADRVGATASFLCAIHCALLPFVLALLPFAGLGFLADHGFERGFVLFACALALFALIRGYRRHQGPLPLMLATPGLALLLLGVTYAEGYSIILHSVLVTCGGLLVASAHFVNLRADRHLGHAHAHEHPHLHRAQGTHRDARVLLNDGVGTPRLTIARCSRAVIMADHSCKKSRSSHG